jgi:hypothetical protein
MPLNHQEIRGRAQRFAHEWATASRERAEAQSFWNAFFDIFGISRRRVASFEEPVKLLGERRGSIDLLWPGLLIVEHKSLGEDLDRAYRQAVDYFPGLEEERLPRYVLVSDFARFRLHDLETGVEEPFTLAQLPQKLHLFSFITGYQRHETRDADPVNEKAAQKIAELHDALLASGYRGHELEMLLVRLVYCLFADDTGIFTRDVFDSLIREYSRPDGSDLGPFLHSIFELLNTPPENRSRALIDDLLTLPYVNGGLFEERLSVPTFSLRARNLLLLCFESDWSTVSPAIFGSMFQYVMISEGTERRHAIGGHYTSEQNILKLIRSLFMDDLNEEFQRVSNDRRALTSFHDKLSRLRFFDPACGCGNFLVIAYRELRRLEMRVINRRGELDPQLMSDPTLLCRVDVHQLTAFEIEQNPAHIARVAVWITDHQMNQELNATFGANLTRLPLVRSADVRQENALRADWHELFTLQQLVAGEVFIFGNPPFVAKANRNAEQNDDMRLVFGVANGTGVLDYVCCWFQKTAEFIRETNVRSAFVATNSITQGEQVPALWRRLFALDVHIDFAHRTFKWTNEASSNAAVFCVIIGFSNGRAAKWLFEYETPTSDPIGRRVAEINPYLLPMSERLYVKSRTAPLHAPRATPDISFGSMPNDGGHLLLTENEYHAFLEQEPAARRYMRPFKGSKEFLQGGVRYCLWLKGADPQQLRRMPLVTRRIRLVAAHRAASLRETTQALPPSLFGEDRQPTRRYLMIPSVSSERRAYIPMEFQEPEVVASNLCLTVEDATMFHFGVLSSEMHMAWVRTVAGRLESRYRYSNQIVYNTFPWPQEVSDAAHRRVTQCAEAVLAARRAHPNATLADLYDPDVMPAPLATAHRSLDRAVDACYRRAGFDSEIQRVIYLFELYRQLDAPLVRIAGRRRRGA